MADWSNLPRELLNLIAVRLFSVVENKLFRSICRSWRSSIPRLRKSRPLIYPFITTQENNLAPGTGRYAYLSRASFFRVALSSSSSQGWLIKSAPVVDINEKNFSLLHPFSRFALPHSCESLNLLEFTVSNIRVAYAVVNRIDGRPYRDFIRVVIVKVKKGDHQLLGISWDGNIKSWDGEVWSRVNEVDNQFSDIIVHKGLTYALDSKDIVWLISSDLRIIRYGPLLFDETITNGYSYKSFVECCGELYIVESLLDKRFRKRKADFSDHNVWTQRRTIGFKVFKMDKELGKCIEVKTLGDYAFVMATDTCFSVLAHEFYGCLKNSIYFTNESIKVFKLNNGKGSIKK